MSFGTPPVYNFTYSCISYSLNPASNVKFDGGNFGIITNTNTSYTNSGTAQQITDTEALQTELGNLTNFRTNFIANLGGTPQTDPGGTRSFLPYPNWYELSDFTGQITFEATNNNDLFYIYIPDNGSYVSLTNIVWVLSENAHPINIYIVSDAGLSYSNPQNNEFPLYGNIICEYIFMDGYDSGYFLNGSLATLGNTNSSLISSVNFSTIECFMEGTKILTDRWYVPIEDLKVGDLVITHGEIHDNKTYVVDVDTPMPIVKIHTYYSRYGSKSSSPVVVTKNAFSLNKPFQDLYVTENHGMVNRKGILHAANKYINRSTIYKDPSINNLTYYHIELASHYAITANGVLVESYLKPTMVCAPPSGTR
jgi:hypothetical protein